MKNSIEIEKKFIIKRPTAAAIAEMESYAESEIVQIYLDAPRGRTHRIRSRTADGVTVYTETEKLRIDAMSAFEDEREIDAERFAVLSEMMRSDSRPVIKKRVSFSYGGLIYEVDIYPEWKSTCIMEVELPTKDTAPSLPPFIEIVADVTGDRDYSNSSMATRFPTETVI